MTITVAVTSGIGVVTAGKLVAFDRVATFSVSGLASGFYGAACTGLLTTADGKTAIAALATGTASGAGALTLAFDCDTAPMLELMGPGKQAEYAALLTIYKTATTDYACRCLVPLVTGARSGSTTVATTSTAASLAEAQALVDAHAVSSLHTYPTTGKNPPLDADVLTLWDSAASYARKALTLASLKTFLAYLTQAAADLRYALLAHTHAGSAQGPKLAQANTHESADTDAAPTSIHHTTGTGANQAAAGNHGHTLTKALAFDFDGGGAALVTAAKCLLPYLPANFTPTRWTLQCSSAARNAAAANASVAMTVTVGNFSTSALPAGATGGTQPSVTTAIGATAAATFTDLVWDAGQAVMVELTGTPTAFWATLTIEGTVTG